MLHCSRFFTNDVTCFNHFFRFDSVLRTSNSSLEQANKHQSIVCNCACNSKNRSQLSLNNNKLADVSNRHKVKTHIIFWIFNKFSFFFCKLTFFQTLTTSHGLTAIATKNNKLYSNKQKIFHIIVFTFQRLKFNAFIVFF